jgi:hypothetical protein
VHVRWDDLFADLGAQLDAAERRDLELEVADRSRAAAATITLLGRLRAAVGREVELAAGAAVLRGRVAAVGADWVLLRVGGPLDEVLVPAAGLRWVGGLPAAAVDDRAVGVVDQRLDLALALRAVARHRVPVILELQDGVLLRGLLRPAGVDAVDVTTESGGRTVPFAALASVRASVPSG